MFYGRTRTDRSTPLLNILQVGGGMPVPGGPGGLSSLKASLKDPAFVSRVKKLEDKRQVSGREPISVL